MKRMISSVLIVILVFISVPVFADSSKVNALGEVIDYGTCGPALTWELTDDNVLTISGRGTMNDYTAGNAPWYGYRSANTSKDHLHYIQSIVVKKGVTSIGDYAFSFLNYASGVSLPSTISTIGDYAFANMVITSVKLPAALVSIGKGAFSYCLNLQTVTIPDEVDAIGIGAFENCKALTHVTIPGSIGPGSFGAYTFENCTRLTHVILTEGLAALSQGIFSGCSALTAMVIPEGVESIGYDAFKNCSRLKQISIPESLSTVGSFAFFGCNALAEVDYGGGERDWSNISISNYNEPLVSAKVYCYSYNPFIDISAKDWFFRPVLWASEMGVTAGTTSITFDPDKTCTRAEFVTFLYKFAGKPWDSSWTKECSFSDVKTSDWYYRAIVWANHVGVTHGIGGGKFSPNTTLDRGMVISFLYNMETYLVGKPTITLTSTRFKDVPKEKYYYTPVLWAEQYKITNGTSATTFSPAKKCTRAEAVTFLYNISQYWTH